MSVCALATSPSRLTDWSYYQRGSRRLGCAVPSSGRRLPDEGTPSRQAVPPAASRPNHWQDLAPVSQAHAPGTGTAVSRPAVPVGVACGQARQDKLAYFGDNVGDSAPQPLEAWHAPVPVCQVGLKTNEAGRSK